MNTTKFTFYFTLLLLITLTFSIQAQQLETKTIEEYQQEKSKKESNLNSSKPENSDSPAIKITKETIDASKSVITIIDANLHQRFLNKEFRDFITSLFGVDYLVVSTNEPIIKITILNSEIERICIDQFSYSKSQISVLNVSK